MPTYDLSLFESLNEEFAKRGLLPSEYWEHGSSVARRVQLPTLEPLKVDSDLANDQLVLRRAARRFPEILRSVNPAGKDLLEVGCGKGVMARLMMDHGGARSVIGVDLREDAAWEAHRSAGVKFAVGDMSLQSFIADGSIDIVYSTVVLEHVRQPLLMLAAIRRVLRPNGLAWLRLNLYCGTSASHRYNRVYVPWPHLLFDDEVCDAFHRKHFGFGARWEWINRLTIAEYLVAVAELGFDVTQMLREVTPIPVDFYLRFADRLAPWPALDLETNYLTLVLKLTPADQRNSQRTPFLGIAERQQALMNRISHARLNV